MNRRGKSKDRSRDKLKDKKEETERVEGAFAFQILPQDVSKQLLEMDVDDIQRKLCEFFNLNEWTTDLRQASILDYYTGAVWWAKEQGFNDQQMSGFFTACHILLDNIKEKQMKLVDNIIELKQMLVGIGSGTELTGQTPSGGMEFFDDAQGQVISKYIFGSLFQHYRLYEYMFQKAQDEEIIGTDLEIDVAKDAAQPFPPPLDEGIEEAKYEAFVKTPPPSQAQAHDGVEDGADKPKEKPNEIDLDAEVFSRLSAKDVQEVVESVATEMLGGLQNDIMVKLRDKENTILARINKIHITS